MSQVTWRASEDLIARVRAAAASERRSVNEFLTRVMDAVTDPELAGTEATRVRERLARAGLLAPAGPPRQPPDRAQLAAARRVAGGGTPLADLVERDR